MTGEEAKQKAIVTLRSHVWNMPSPEAAEEACAEALAALYPCIVLTAEEAAQVRECVSIGEGELDQNKCCSEAERQELRAEYAPIYALLEAGEPDPIIPGYGTRGP
jgi:hypothetical protein